MKGKQLVRKNCSLESIKIRLIRCHFELFSSSFYILLILGFSIQYEVSNPDALSNFFLYLLKKFGKKKKKLHNYKFYVQLTHSLKLDQSLLHLYQFLQKKRFTLDSLHEQKKIHSIHYTFLILYILIYSHIFVQEV